MTKQEQQQLAAAQKVHDVQVTLNEALRKLRLLDVDYENVNGKALFYWFHGQKYACDIREMEQILNRSKEKKNPDIYKPAIDGGFNPITYNSKFIYTNLGLYLEYNLHQWTMDGWSIVLHEEDNNCTVHSRSTKKYDGCFPASNDEGAMLFRLIEVPTE